MSGTLLAIWTPPFVAGLPLRLHGSDWLLPIWFMFFCSLWIRSVYPGALRGILASFLTDTSLRKLRTAIFKVVWSRRQPLVNVGAVLGLLDGPHGCDSAFCAVWVQFRMLRGYFAYWPGEIPGIYRLLGCAAGGCPRHGPVHLLVDSAAEIGFQCDSCQRGWERPGRPVLSNYFAGPIQHHRSAVLEAWRSEVAADLCVRKGVRGGPWLDIHGTLQLLNPDHVRER